MLTRKPKMLRITFINMCVILTCLSYTSSLVKSATATSQSRRQSIRRDMNTTIGVNTYYSVASWLQCTTKCTEDLSLSLYYNEADQTCQCNNDIDVSTEEDPSKPEIVYGEFEKILKIEKIREFTKWTTIPRKPDCKDLLQYGFSENGVYVIQPDGQAPVDTWCDMQNGGWTVIQRRMDGSEDFYRGWDDYVSGFGNRTGEYWLGLDNIHALTTQPSKMYIYAEAFEGASPLSGYANYSTVTVSVPSDNYRLHADGYTGTCGNPFFSQFNGMQFSTFDRDNDNYVTKDCAEAYRGAWWYEACHLANLNGYYYGGHHDTEADGVNWLACWDHHYSVKKTEIKVWRK